MPDAVAYQPTNEAETRLVTWLEEGGCSLTQKDFMNRALSAEGLAPSDLMAARRAMTKAGSLIRADGGLALTTGAACGTGAASDTASTEVAENTDRARIMAMFEANDCTLTEDQLPDVAAQFQVTRKQFRPTARAMEDAGELVEDGNAITLTAGEICGGSTAKATPAADTPEMASVAMIAAMEAANCTIDEAMAVAIGTEQGFSPASIDDAFDLLEDNGSIVISDDRDSARLVKGTVCEKVAAARVDAYAPENETESTVFRMFEENGCTLTEGQLPALGEKYGIDKDAFRTAGRAMMKAGVFTEKEGAITLLGGRCAVGAAKTDAPDDKRAIAIGVFEANGCTLSREQARTLFPAAGLSLDEDRDLIRGMIDDGDVSLNRLTREATLQTGDVCGDVPSPRAKIIALFEANDCRMTEEQAEVQFPQAGLDLDRDGDVIEAMFDAGELIEGDGNDAQLVIGARCEVEANSVKNAVIAAFEFSDCSLTEDGFEAALTGGPVDVDEAQKLVTDMMVSGEIVYDKETRKARLMIGDTCQQ